MKNKVTTTTNARSSNTNNTILVDWYSDDDKENPQNWSQSKKAFVAFVIGAYSFVVHLGQMGAAFLAIVVGTIISFVIYNIYIHKTHVPRSRSPKAPTKPETVLIPALFACFGPSIGLFLFGWAARPEVHWIVPTIGIVIYPVCVFILLQCVFLYIPGCYPQYAASVFAATDFTPSAFACGAVIFSRPLYLNLRVGRECSLLGVCFGDLFVVSLWGGVEEEVEVCC